MLSLFFAYISVKDIKKNDKLTIIHAKPSRIMGVGSIISGDETKRTISYVGSLATKQEGIVFNGEPLMPDYPSGRNWPILYTCYLPPSKIKVKAVLIDVYGGGEAREYYAERYFYRILAHNGIAVVEAELSDLTHTFRRPDGTIKPRAEYSKEDIDLVLYDIAYLRTHLQDIRAKNPYDPINKSLQALATKPTFITGFSFGGFMSFNFVTKNPEQYNINGKPYNALFDGAIAQAGFIARFKNDRPIDSLSNLLKGATNIDDIEPILGQYLMPQFSPILGLKNLQIPVLFTHGTADELINSRHTAEAKLIGEKFGKGDLISPYTIRNIQHTWPSSKIPQISSDPESLSRLDGYAQVVLSFIDSVIEGRNNISAQQKDFRKKIEEYRLSKILKEDVTTEEQKYPIIPDTEKEPKTAHEQVYNHLFLEAILGKYDDKKLITKLIENIMPNLDPYMDTSYIDMRKDEISLMMYEKLEKRIDYAHKMKRELEDVYHKLLYEVYEKNFFNSIPDSIGLDVLRPFNIPFDLIDKLEPELATKALLIFYEEITRPIYFKPSLLLNLMKEAHIATESNSPKEVRELAERYENEIRPIMNKKWEIIPFEEFKEKIEEVRAPKQAVLGSFMRLFGAQQRAKNQTPEPGSSEPLR